MRLKPFAAALFLTTTALAQPSPTDKAAAHTLFREWRAPVTAGKTEDGCAKRGAIQKLAVPAGSSSTDVPVRLQDAVVGGGNAVPVGGGGTAAEPKSGGGLRTVGFVVGGVGLAGIVVGSIFGALTISQNAVANGDC